MSSSRRTRKPVSRFDPRAYPSDDDEASEDLADFEEQDEAEESEEEPDSSMDEFIVPDEDETDPAGVLALARSLATRQRAENYYATPLDSDDESDDDELFDEEEEESDDDECYYYYDEEEEEDFDNEESISNDETITIE